VGTPSSLNWDSREAERALLCCRIRGRRFLLESVDIFDDNKDRKGNDHKAYNRVDENAYIDCNCPGTLGSG